MPGLLALEIEKADLLFCTALCLDVQDCASARYALGSRPRVSLGIYDSAAPYVASRALGVNRVTRTGRYAVAVAAVLVMAFSVISQASALSTWLEWMNATLAVTLTSASAVLGLVCFAVIWAVALTRHLRERRSRFSSP